MKGQSPASEMRICLQEVLYRTSTVKGHSPASEMKIRVPSSTVQDQYNEGAFSCE
jgi:hypothetical protein